MYKTIIFGTNKQSSTDNDDISSSDELEESAELEHNYYDYSHEREELFDSVKLGEIYNSIPKHCFEISTFTSLCYFFRDISILAALYLIALPFGNNYIYPVPYIGPIFYLFYYIAWSILTALTLWGLWSIGHDCGHKVFSTNVLINDIVGHISWTLSLYPFYSYQRSHNIHHSNVNELDRDYKVFTPPSEKEYYVELPQIFRYLKETHLVSFLPFGFSIWAFNEDMDGNHLNPYSIKLYVGDKGFISTFSIILFVFLMFYSFNFSDILLYYYVPSLIENWWSTVIGFLHHSHPCVHYFRTKKGFGHKEWLRAQYQTIDRSYGWFIDEMQHYISIHLLHHLFPSKLPHYHLVEATNAAKKVLGKLYLYDDTPWIEAMHKYRQALRFVPNKGDNIKYIIEKPVENMNGKLFQVTQMKCKQKELSNQEQKETDKKNE